LGEHGGIHEFDFGDFSYRLRPIPCQPFALATSTAIAMHWATIASSTARILLT
jgi:hypothetical protein